MRNQELSWRSIALQAAGMWLATRLVFAGITYFAFIFNSEGYDASRMGLGGAFPPHVLLQSWDRWDTSWYLRIALEGYAADPLRTAFFPLYPLLIFLFSFVFGTADLNRLVAGLVVSNLSALAAFIAVGLLAAQEEGPRLSPYAIRAVAAYPLAFFMTAAYSDGLFLALATFSLFFARRGTWHWATLCAFLAGLTRPTGLILVLPLLWEYARQHGWDFAALHSKRWREGLRVKALAIGALVAAAVPLALGVYALYLWQLFGDPRISFRVQTLYWKHQFVPPWELPVIAFKAVANVPMWSFLQARVLIDLLPLIIFTALALYAALRPKSTGMPVSFTLYTLGAIYISVAAPMPTYFHPYSAVGRFLIMAVPIFLLAGRWMMRYPWLDLMIVSGGFMLQGILVGFFLMGGWII